MTVSGRFLPSVNTRGSDAHLSSDADLSSSSAATRLVSDAMQQAVLRGLAVWQIFIILTVLATPLSRLTTVLVITAHVLLLLAFLCGAIRRWPPMPIVLVNFALIIVDYAVAETPSTPLAFAAVWTAILTCATPGLIVRSVPAVITSTAAIMILTVAQIILRPDWPVGNRLMFLVASITLTCGVLVFIRSLRHAASHADHQSRRAQRARHQELLVQRTGREIAEDARILHDTIINTLAAIARGDALRTDSHTIRARCAHDVAVITERAQGEPRNRPGFGLDELRARAGIKIVSPYSSADDLTRFEALLPDDISDAIGRAILELVNNAAAHAGVDQVTIDASIHDARLVVIVADAGTGFDGRPVPGRGLAESVFRRCEEVGVTVTLRSSPGQGTTVTLTYPLGLDTGAEATAETVHRLDVTSVARAGCWVWAATILIADLALSLVRSEHVGLVSLVTTATVSVVTLASWISSHDRRYLPAWLTVLVIAIVPAMFTVSLIATISWGASLIELQAVLLTVPLYILLVTRQTQSALGAALVVLGITVASLSFVLFLTRPELALAPLIAVCPQLGLFAGLHTFLQVLSTIAEAYERQRRAALDAEGNITARVALSLARDRWIHAGARSATALLDQIATGQADPHDRTVQIKCAEEENYLRQLLTLDTELLQLSPWLALALAHARSRRVALHIRSGTIDAPDTDTAHIFGRALLAAIDACSPSETLSAGLFSEGGQQVALILGPLRIVVAIQHATDATSHEIRHETLTTHALITIRPRVPQPTHESSADRITE